MIAAACELYLVSGKEMYLHAAERADAFIQKNLCESGALFVSFRAGKRGTPGFLDDYAAYIFALLQLYKATLKFEYAERAAVCASAQQMISATLRAGFIYTICAAKN